MKLITRLSNSSFTKSTTLVSFVSILAVIGPIVIVSAGFWDAISHLQKEPEFFLESISHYSILWSIYDHMCCNYWKHVNN